MLREVGPKHPRVRPFELRAVVVCGRNVWGSKGGEIPWCPEAGSREAGGDFLEVVTQRVQVGCRMP